MSRIKRASFVVRVVEDRHGQLSGIIERAATGAKEPFSGMDVIGQVIQRMFRREAGPPAASKTPTPDASRQTFGQVAAP